MKPLIIGMNNPISTRPGHELYPAPEGCTGHRLWRLLHARTGASRLQYLESFDRCNLVRDVAWSHLTARARAFEMTCELQYTGLTVMLLGQSVREAFDRALVAMQKDLVNEGFTLTDGDEVSGLPPVLIHPQLVRGITWRQVPHPSGRNLWYNDAENRKLVELLMEELYNEYKARK